MKIRNLALSLLVLMLVAAACGDDDSGTPVPATTAPATGGSSGYGGTGDDGSAGTPTPSATGGFLMMGDERIDFDSARCYLEEQDAFGGGKILAVAQAYGTNSEGVDVTLDFTRFDQDTDFTGDDLSVTVGDISTGEYVEYGDVIDLGSVSIEGRNVAGTGFNLTSFDINEQAEFAASFEVNC